MLALERKNRILDRVQQEGKVIVSVLSKEFDVSEETIRRDLEKLEEEGYVTKSYGGAVAKEKNSIDLPFNVRRNANPEGKRIIAKLIASRIEEGETLFLDASTTAVFIAKELKARERLTVITNSIENLIELADQTNWNIISTGGTLSGGSMSLLGGRTAEVIQSYHTNKVILSCKGLDIEKGVTDGNPEIASIKRAMLDAADTVILAADSTKFDRVAFSRLCDLPDIDCIITEKKPDDLWIRYFKEHGIELVYGE